MLPITVTGSPALNIDGRKPFYFGASLAVCFIAGCTPLPNETLMQTIEQNVTLPKEAAPLSRYRRYYAWSSDKQRSVEAV